MRDRFALSYACCFFVLAGCGSSQTSGSPDGGGEDAGSHDAAPHDARTDTTPIGDAGRDASSGDTGSGADTGGSDAGADAPTDGATSGCPSSPPAPYSPCSEAFLYCSWGDDPRFQCRTRAECNAYVLPDGGTPGLVWRTGTDDVPAQNCTSPAPDCPGTAPPLAEGGPNPPCTEAQAGLTCAYSGVVVTCAPCPGPTLCFALPDGGIPYQWFQTTLAKDCPEAPPKGKLPNWGDPCKSPGLHCGYNQCVSTEPGAAAWAEGVLLRCASDGTWTGLEQIDSGACL